MIYELLESSSQLHSENIAVSCMGVSITYNKLYENVRKLALELTSRGVQRGDNVVIAMDNSIEFIEAFFAVNLCGAIIVPLYVQMGSAKLINIIRFYEIRYIITLSKYNNIFRELPQNDCGELNGVFYMDGIDPSLNCQYSEMGGQHRKLEKREENELDVAIILFSSGTTQIPKGIMLSDSNIVSNVMSISHYLQLSENDRILLIKNINHASSITGEMLVSISNGCTLFLTHNMPTASSMLELIHTNAITVFFAVPTMLSAILEHRYLDRYNLRTLRIVNFYGASISISKIRELADKFEWANIIYSYGLTEAAPRVTYIEREDLLKKEGSSGVPIKDVSIYILDQEGRVLDSGCIGQIAVKGPNVMRGYYKNEELTKKALHNGILHTGDMGYLDKDGYLYVTGRKDNLIIKAGKNIYPEEIESAIAGYEGIKEVLVRGEADDLAGEDIVAYIVASEGSVLNIRQIYMHCKDNLEDYKIPGKIFLVDHLEKTLSGKCVRKQEIVINGV